jgi:hypothetical protein
MSVSWKPDAAGQLGRREAEEADTAGTISHVIHDISPVAVGDFVVEWQLAPVPSDEPTGDPSTHCTLNLIPFEQMNQSQESKTELVRNSKGVKTHGE